MALIRSIAEHSDRVFFGEHAFERLGERDSRHDLQLNDRVALRVLRCGDILGNVRPGDSAGEWVVKVVGPVNHDRGARNVGVVTVVLDAGSLFVKTVEWEDRR
jgi:hypothetical protein